MKLQAPTRSLLRVVVALVASCGVALGVTACEVKPGAAAFVGDTKISEAELGQYLTPTAPPSATSGSTNPRSLALSTLIRANLWIDYLAAHSGVPSDAVLAASRDAALTQAFQSGSAPTQQQLESALAGVGLTASFAPVFTREAELLYVAVQEITKADAKADVAKVVTTGTPRVSVSPRYGTWNTTTLNLASSTPPYLQLATSTGA